MAAKKVLIVGIDPYIIDLSSPEFSAFPGLTAQKVEAGIKGAIQHLNEKGFDADLCWTDFGLSAASTLKDKLQQVQFDIVLIGAGIRVPGNNFMLFEQLINVIHTEAPQACICFNTNPADTVAAVERWT
ncbi:hypothetical protein GCM10023093_19360 [Nemorincola caseinilytica]|uniref:Uncharacterized protein n=1 Tax=Nemorincola caseinilytica TaxID=2054315 RepID=A0ABP8NHM5_9BACT